MAAAFLTGGGGGGLPVTAEPTPGLVITGTAGADSGPPTVSDGAIEPSAVGEATGSKAGIGTARCCSSTGTTTTSTKARPEAMPAVQLAPQAPVEGQQPRGRRVRFDPNPVTARYEAPPLTNVTEEPQGKVLLNTFDLSRALQSEGAPDVLIAFEFSGALVEALAAEGVEAMSADWRAPEHHRWHYQGDVRTAVAAKQWQAILFVGPNCYQHMKRDRHLEYKINDCRAYWAGAMVLWCIACQHTRRIIVEQPDTIVAKYVQPDALPGVRTLHLRTSFYEDSKDEGKYLRLWTVNVDIGKGTFEAKGKAVPGDRDLTAFADADERDRSRSSLKQYPGLCKAIASGVVKALETSDPPASRVSFHQLIRHFSRNWSSSGHPLPPNCHNSRAEPLDADELVYQEVRGRGRGGTGCATPSHEEVQSQGVPRGDVGGGEVDAPKLPPATKIEGAKAATRPRAILVPLHTRSDEPLAAINIDGELFTLPEPSAKLGIPTSVIKRAESWSSLITGTTKSIFGYRVGRTSDDADVIATLSADEQPTAQAGVEWVGRREASKKIRAKAALSLVTIALATVSRFQTFGAGTTTILRAEGLLRQVADVKAGRSGLLAPRRGPSRDASGVTPRSLIPWANRGLAQLRYDAPALLREKGPAAAEWIDAVRPLDLADVPEQLLDKPLGLDPQLVRSALFSEPLPIYETPWLARQPQQRWAPSNSSCIDYKPKSARDLTDPTCWRDFESWLEAQRLDLICMEEKGEKCDRRKRPPATAFGQGCLHPCARGYVWDCRGLGGCKLLDYEGELSTNFNLQWLRAKFKGHPDQRLASNVIEGVRLEADVPMQIALNPHLVSLGAGFDAVQQKVRELKTLSFYDFANELPFVPIVVVGQGSRYQNGKYRRTSDFSAPHKAVADGDGVLMTPVNEASKSYYQPPWLIDSARADVRDWAKNRYAHVPPPQREGEQPSVRHKFPREYKPQIGDVAWDIAIQLDAAWELGLPLFIVVHDKAHYFNQFGYSPEELWKSTLVTSGRHGDSTSPDIRVIEEGELTFVIENRLGFGSYASCNIAQRFANALNDWTLQRFDELEEADRLQPGEEKWRAWYDRRKGLEEECRRRRPKKKGEALSDCTQTRLATLRTFTDDRIATVVGVRSLANLAIASHDTLGPEGANVLMSEGKQQVGADVKWVGVLILGCIGLLVVPPNKLLRAKEAIVRILNHQSDFDEYRKLMGLIEHVRFVSQRSAESTVGLYRPHGSAHETDPGEIVKPDGLMREQLTKWLEYLSEEAGTVVTIAHIDTPHEMIERATAIVAATADAAGRDYVAPGRANETQAQRGKPGAGGYIHGLYWRIPPTGPAPEWLLLLLHITSFETLATFINAYVARRLGGPEATIHLGEDALLTPYVVSKEKSSSLDIQEILHCATSDVHYREVVSRNLVTEQISGDANLFADLVSRDLIDELHGACEAIRVRPRYIELDERERTFIRLALSAVAARKGVELTHVQLSELWPTVRSKRENKRRKARSRSPSPASQRSRGLLLSQQPEQVPATKGLDVSPACSDHDGPWVRGADEGPEARAHLDVKEWRSNCCATSYGICHEIRPPWHKPVDSNNEEIEAVIDRAEDGQLVCFGAYCLECGRSCEIVLGAMVRGPRERGRWVLCVRQPRQDLVRAPPWRWDHACGCGRRGRRGNSRVNRPTSPELGPHLPPRPPSPADRKDDPVVGSSSSSALSQEVIEHASSQYLPVWLRKPTDEAAAEHGSVKREQVAAENEKGSSSYAPTWIKMEASPKKERRSGKAPLNPRRGTSSRHHPYAQPAYSESRMQPHHDAAADSLADRLIADDSPGAIRAPPEQLRKLARTVMEARVDGVNPRTASKEDLALREFELFAKLWDFDPNRLTAWATEFPERENLIMSGFLLFRGQRMQPRSKKDKIAKPMSVYQSYLALRRVFRARGQPLPNSGEVRETLRGMLRRYLRRIGIESLRAKRSEPVKPSTVRQIVRDAKVGKHSVGGKPWNLKHWKPFIVTSWEVVNLSVGSRLAESAKLPGDEDENDWFTRASVTYTFNGVDCVDPTRKQLEGMKHGDLARLAPKGSKCDTWGTCHGTEPIILPFEEDDLNAAKWLRDIELRMPCRGAERKDTALFCDEEGEPYSDTVLRRAIKATLVNALGASEAAHYSPHSWRVSLATRLRLLKCSDAEIQALLRWLNPESLRIYTRMTNETYGNFIQRAMAIEDFDAKRTTNLPVHDVVDLVPEWEQHLREPRKRGRKPKAAQSDDDEFDCAAEEAERREPAERALEKGTRIAVYWTDLDDWFTATVLSSRLDRSEEDDRRLTHVLYDAAGGWSKRSELSYWHCLAHECYKVES